MSSSPTSLVFPGSPPVRDAPNSHPYAIKTSSSAVLTRTNSTGHRFDVNHHYTPPSPTKNPIGTRQSRYVPSRSHLNSLPSPGGADTSPPPVPMPFSASLPARLANQGNLSQGDGYSAISDGEVIPPTPPLTLRIKRSDTLPSIFVNKSDAKIGVEDLPNPKIWTPSQLSVYLASALRLKGGATLPVPVSRDISMFVIKEHLSGRVFLRMKREDYDALGINQLWKDALLDASRVLRQNLVQGRIMGFGSEPSTFLSSEDALLVEEEAASAGPPAYSPLDLTHRRVPRSPSLPWEEDKKRMGKTSFRVGRVRGMVETYERSCSESSASGSECDESENSPTRLESSQLVCEPVEDEGGFASGENTTSDDEGSTSITSTPANDQTISSELDQTSAEAYTGDTTTSPEPVGTVGEGPSIDVLLREQQNAELQDNQYQSWGAKAWEDEINNPAIIHATAKRVPLHNGTVTSGLPFLKPHSRDTGVLAVPSDDVAPKDLTELFSELRIKEVPQVECTKAVDVILGDESKNVAQAPSPAVHEALKTFEMRLEIVEKKIDEMERMDEEKNRLLRQKQLEAERLHAEKSQPRNNESAVQPGRCSVVPKSSEPELQERRKVRNYTATDPSISGLPGYMFLISLGVVAITMRVVLRRIIGDRRRA